MPLGGAETIIIQQLSHLDRRYFEVHFIAFKNRGMLLKEAQEKADNYACLKRKTGLDLIAILKLRRYIISHNIDIVHTNEWLDSLYVVLATIGIPIIKLATIHGYDCTWRNYVNLFVLKHFEQVISVSRSLKLDLYKIGIKLEKILVINNSYDPECFHYSKPKKDRSRGGPVRILMVGNFQWCKDHKTLVEAVFLLTKQGYNVELNLVGRGENYLLQANKKRVNKLNLEKVIKFWGSRRTDWVFLSQFDIYAFSSLCDTFGIALLEAMACGMPVIVSDIPPFMELIKHGECGLYFKTGDPSSCAKAIKKLIRDPELMQIMGERAAKRAQFFSPQRAIRDLESAYTKLLNGASRCAE